MMVWLLIPCFVVLLLLALAIAVYPLRHGLWRSLPASLLALVVFTLPAYYMWGGWTDWLEHEHAMLRQQEAKAMLATVSSPQELIDRLRARLDDSPASARGWYLLGRLYSGQKQWQPARDAYAKSLQLDAENVAAALGYVETLWQLNSQQYNDDIRQRLNAILKKHPDQPDALSMLAMDAYEQKQYEQAITYWRQILALVPAQSDEAKALRKAIAKAQEQLPQ